MPATRTKRITTPFLLPFILAAGSLMTETPSVRADDATEAGVQPTLQEVVVTAQKRRQDLQKVPISATAIDSNELTQKRMTMITDIAKVTPNLHIYQDNGYASPEFTLRGIGNATFSRTTDSAVMVYLDEFTLSPSTAKAGQLFDLERIEVLRGPQGTLYGRNSTAGAINFITRRPDGTTEADGTATVGNFGEYDFEGGAQTAVADNLSVRVAVNRNYSQGYGFDRTLNEYVNGVDDWGGRMELRYKTSKLEIYLKLMADGQATASQNAWHIAVTKTGMPIPGNVTPVTGYVQPSYDTHDEQYQLMHLQNRSTTLNLSYDLGAGYTFTSITGYLHTWQEDAQDIDGSPFRLADIPLSNFHAHEFSQDLRISSPVDQRLTWIAGADYFRQTLGTPEAFALDITFPTMLQNHYETAKSYAGYADGTLQLGGGFSLTGGVRLTHDEKDAHFLSGPFEPNLFLGSYDIFSSGKWTEPTYRAVLSYQLLPQTMLYASYSHGYRAGAFDSGFKTNPAQFSPVNPEFVNNYEGGIKSTILNNRLRYALSFFYMQFKNMQLSDTPASGICCAVVNAGKSRIYGPELQGEALLTDKLTVSISGTISEAKFIDFVTPTGNYDGLTLGYIPKYQVRVSPEYHIPVKLGYLFIAPDVTVTGRERMSLTPQPYGLDVQRAFTIFDAQAGYRSDSGFSVFAWIKNATNYRYINQTSDDTTFGFFEQILGPPRMFGMTATARF